MGTLASTISLAVYRRDARKSKRSREKQLDENDKKNIDSTARSTHSFTAAHDGP